MKQKKKCLIQEIIQDTITKLAIEKAQKDMFYYLYELAEKKHNNEEILEFFDKLDKTLNFN